MYKITLADGTVLKNLELNGNNYIAEGVIEDSVFEGNLDTVTVTDGKTTETFTDMRLMSNRVVEGKSWWKTFRSIWFRYSLPPMVSPQFPRRSTSPLWHEYASSTSRRKSRSFPCATSLRNAAFFSSLLAA